MALRQILLIVFFSYEILHIAKSSSDEDQEMFATGEDDFVQRITVSSETEFCATEQRCKCTSYKSGVKVDCSYTGLSKIPQGFPKNTMRLNLKGNKIEQITAETFKNYSKMTVLDLSENNLKQLRLGAFNGLGNLSSLFLTNNKIRYTNTSIPTGTFQPLAKLQCLRIQQNLKDFKIKETYPIEAIKNLTRLSDLSIDGLPFKFTSEFSNLKKLTKLHLGRVRESGRCFITRVENNTFQYLPKLQQLQMTNCSLKTVENGSFSELHNLKLLDLSNNEDLQFKSLENITYGLQFTKVGKLNLTKIHHTFGDCTKLDAQNIKYLRKLQLRSLILDSNRLSFITADAVKFIPTTLTELSLRDNILLVGTYVLFIIIKMERLFQNLKIFIMSQQRLSHSIKFLWNSFLSSESDIQYHSLQTRQKKHENGKNHLLGKRSDNYQNTNSDIPLNILNQLSNMENTSELEGFNSVYNFNNFFSFLDAILNISNSGLGCSNCKYLTDKKFVSITLPPQLEYLDVSDTKIRATIRGICVCEPNNLRKINLKKNNYVNWQGPVLGFRNLTEVSLAENLCTKFSYTVFHNMPNLKILDLSNNLLGFLLGKDTEGITFSNLPRLTTLDLTFNNIRNLPKSMFQGLVGLTDLYLGHNLLTTIELNLNMKSLQLVDVPYNLLEEIGPSVRKCLDHTPNITVNLEQNKLKCSCKHLDFLKWMSKTEVHFEYFQNYTCQFDNDTYGNLTYASKIHDTLSKDCANYLPIIFAISGALLFVLILTTCGTLYRYRWSLRYMYYSTKFRLKGYTAVNIEDGEFDYDVFVSYADRDRRFVRQMIVPELEDKRELRLLVHDRDFLAGSFVSENIMQAITTSRKTLIIMTPAFLNSNWCCYEMNMARMEAIKTGRDVLCILMKEKVPTKGLSLEILDIIEEQTYADISDNAQFQEQFWDRLKASLVR